MSENLAIWDDLGKTDPAHTKQFKRAGGFSGTALKPQWAVKRLTERFGPVGKGWGCDKPDFTLVNAQEGEILVYCTLAAWWLDEDKFRQVYGVGGDKAVAKNKYGLTGDDEAFKKAYTDALMNAFKFVGVGADIHLGQFDDSKYVAEVREEFHKPEPNRKADRSKLDGPYKSITALEAAFKSFVGDMSKCVTWEDWVGLQNDKKYAGFLEQAERDHPDWWGGWKGQPDGFVPLSQRIENLELTLAEDKADLARA